MLHLVSMDSPTLMVVNNGVVKVNLLFIREWCFFVFDLQKFAVKWNFVDIV